MIAKYMFVTFLTVISGCSVKHFNFPPKAFVKVEMINNAKDIESLINAQSGISPPEDADCFVVIEGKKPFIITAPHATKPFREGEYRFSDGGGTAALARLLSTLTEASAIYTQFACPIDPNFYDNCSFKTALGQLIDMHRPLLILDIHGSHPYRPYDVDIGTMNGNSILGKEPIVIRLIEDLKSAGIINISYNYFSASQNQTITKFGSAHGIPTIQLEINSSWLAPSQGDLYAHRFAQLLQALAMFLNSIE